VVIDFDGIVGVSSDWSLFDEFLELDFFETEIVLNFLEGD